MINNNRNVYHPLRNEQVFQENYSNSNVHRCLSVLSMRKGEEEEGTNDNDPSFLSKFRDSSIISILGIVSQPVVWISLYYVATTGAGLPAGPFGIIGATEGISYLVVVALVVKKVLFSSNEMTDDTTTST
eukprot:CAMPEP_0194193428 /NCGR_PEP_ID=MMETSP0154-20130528/74553_1 /TAXON_ID=1049557 /ORGANISM="Thalassiothrix antarctica, Strain L6-D1" /LENGTH=129 /DNA_ID=CAMNT_0038917667 /DNA_START=51 /DNA_END=436 /DNA_ORIENTATION=+